MKRSGCCLVFVVVLAGCRHRAPVPAPMTLPPPTPVAVEPADVAAPLVPKVPVPSAPTSAVKLPPRKVKRKKALPPPAPAPAQVASNSAPVPASDVVGALTAGGARNPETQKKAADLITNLEKRLAGLPTQVVDVQKEQISRVKYFWGEAKAALLAGDADGALTLAIKARVLLDDVVK